MKKFQYYIFDFDGTLVDSMPAYCSTILEILEENHVCYPSNITDITTPLGYIGAAKYFRETLGVTRSEEALIERMYELAYHKYRDDVPLKADVESCLRLLKAHGCSLNVLTASPKKVVDVCLKRLGLYELFDNVWSCEDFGTTKSDVRIYPAAVERMGGTMEKTAFLDDNIGAVRTAKKAGLYTVGVYDRSGDSFRREIMEESDLYINSFAELSASVFPQA
ncbi:MAG: HAD family hydrolase [Clostridia bacterium]|nr:HAD family hydrolase [Clostridia bacterium]